MSGSQLFDTQKWGDREFILRPMAFELPAGEGIASTYLDILKQLKDLHTQVIAVFDRFRASVAADAGIYQPIPAQERIRIYAIRDRQALLQIEHPLNNLRQKGAELAASLRVVPPDPNSLVEALRAQEIRQHLFHPPGSVARGTALSNASVLLYAVKNGDASTFNAFVFAPLFIQNLLFDGHAEEQIKRAKEMWIELRNPQQNQNFQMIVDAVKRVSAALVAAGNYIDKTVGFKSAEDTFSASADKRLKAGVDGMLELKNSK